MDSGVGTFPQPQRRFAHIDIDVVDPLPTSQGHCNLFTVIDRTTRWLEAIPMETETLPLCISALLSEWVARFECKNRPTTTISSDNIKLFVGVLLISGYNKIPAETQYWSNDEDLGLQIVKNTMFRSIFQEMKSILHFCDNNEAENNKNDGGFKVRKLIAAAQKSFVKFDIFEEHLAVDEMIVKYYGHNALKQFIRGKAIQFWALYDDCYNLDLYCGKSSSEDKHADLLLGSKVILNILDVVKEPQSYSVFFDNLFAGYE
ncbi:piggyBac transposable element-derived protein 3-like [Palaemon carinicauda]|uniref:piggyBac transposable element-derived protein 3-like n=1 Tax=Palaemon carinicauda TaxID=392227 RepID=UPI0035B5D5C9